jgi:hypothetical protein
MARAGVQPLRPVTISPAIKARKAGFLFLAKVKSTPIKTAAKAYGKLSQGSNGARVCRDVGTVTVTLMPCDAACSQRLPHRGSPMFSHWLKLRLMSPARFSSTIYLARPPAATKHVGPNGVRPWGERRSPIHNAQDLRGTRRRLQLVL